MKRYKLFVSGGAGFIGSNFARYVMGMLPDISVVILDKLTYAGKLENLAEIIDDPRLSFVRGDICDIETVDRSMRDCDWVIHFAAETHVDRSISNPAPFTRTNVEGTLALLEMARKYGISRFVHISTDEVYGSAASPEGSSRPSLETDTLRPYSPYAATKAGAECLAFSYWRTYRVPVVITRCSNNYGPYQYPEKQLPLFITRALAGLPLPVYGDGHSTRDWIHVTDHCTALLSILLAPENQVVGEVFNIGTGQERSIVDNALLVLNLLGLPESLIMHAPDRPGHVWRHVVDTTKLRTRLSWRPSIPFEQGIRDTVVWYKEHNDWLAQITAPRRTL